MGFNLSDVKKRTEPIEGGTYTAVCHMLVDLGTQTGKFGDKRKLVIGFQLLDVLGTRKDGTTFRRTVSRKYGANLNEKGQLRPMLEAWRGRKFTEEELAKFDLRDILGKPALVNVTVEDKGFNGIGGVVPVPKGMAANFTIEGDVAYYSMEDNGLDIPQSIPEWCANLIKESTEYKNAAVEAHEASGGGGVVKDDIPF